MVTTAEFATFQQQLRQDMADVIQQSRVEANESISGRMDMLNSLNTGTPECVSKNQLIPSHTESGTSKETGRAAMRKEN